MTYDNPVYVDSIPILFDVYCKLRTSVQDEGSVYNMMYFRFNDNGKFIFDDNYLSKKKSVL